MDFEIVRPNTGEITSQERDQSRSIEQNIRNYAAKNMLTLDDFWIGGSERVRGLAIDSLRGEGWRIDEDRSGVLLDHDVVAAGAAQPGHRPGIDHLDVGRREGLRDDDQAWQRVLRKRWRRTIPRGTSSRRNWIRRCWRLPWA